jgi:secondary thiamine-phosphate synthase enzyme
VRAIRDRAPRHLRTGALLDDSEVSWTSFQVTTRRRAQLVDITERVAEAVERSGVKDGLCHVFVPHTTAGVTINEGADPDVAADIESHLGELVPKEAAFEHSEGNSDSHIKTVLVGPSCAAPVRDGRLALGTWQAIFLCEWDGPRTRQVEVGVTTL